MTFSRLLSILFLAAAVLFAVYVWPTRYAYEDGPAGEDGIKRELRVDRVTRRTEVRTQAGGWVDYDIKKPPVGPIDIQAERAAGQALKAGEDIRKMNEATQDAIDRGRAGK